MIVIMQTTYCSSSDIGWMREMHIVEQEQDRVQGVVLFGLALFTSTTETSEKKTHEHLACSDPHATPCTSAWRKLKVGIDVNNISLKSVKPI